LLHAHTPLQKPSQKLAFSRSIFASKSRFRADFCSLAAAKVRVFAAILRPAAKNLGVAQRSLRSGAVVKSAHLSSNLMPPKLKNEKRR